VFIPAHVRRQPITGMRSLMPDHDPTRAEAAAELMQVRAAEKAARDEASHIFGRWNGGLAAKGAPVVADHPFAVICEQAVAGRILSGLPDQPGGHKLSRSTEPSDVQVR
jgi:hypothetical protein